MALNYKKFTENQFKSMAPEQGAVYLLHTGSLLIGEEEASSFLLDENNYNEKGELQATLSIADLSRTVAVVISNKNLSGRDCRQHLLECRTIRIYNDTVDCYLSVSTREIEPLGSYTYLPITGAVSKKNDIDVDLAAYSISSDFISYECSFGTVQLLPLPYIDTYFDNSDFNPLISNTTSRTGSIAVPIYVTFPKEGVPERHISEATTNSYGERVNVYAEVADSFYTEMSNILPRYLGCKTGFGNSTYTGFKEKFRRDNVRALSASLASNQGSSGSSGLEPAFDNYTSFSGSVFVSGTSDQALRDMSLSDMQIERLYFSATHSYVPDSETSAGYITYISIDSEPGTVLDSYQRMLPVTGDVVYRMSQTGGFEQHRVTNSEIYSVDQGAKLITNGLGIVVGIVPIRVAGSGSSSGSETGSMIFDGDVLIRGNLKVVGSASVAEGDMFFGDSYSVQNNVVESEHEPEVQSSWTNLVNET